MGQRHILEVANFTCRIGGKNLLEVFEQIVKPAFLDKKLRRRYGETEYFLDDVGVEAFAGSNGPEDVVFGRIIKKTKLKSQQTFVEGAGLVKRKSSIDDAPSSVFALILKNHRLLMVNETPFAPDVNAFASTMKRFINEKRRLFVEQYAREHGVSIGAARDDVGDVYLHVIPLPSYGDIDKFIDSFALIKKVTVDVLKTNHERDRAIWKEELKNSAGSLNPSQVTVEVKHSSGLPQQELKDFVHPLVADGTSRVTLTGSAADGQKLRGDTTEFKLKQEIGLGAAIRGTVENMLASFAAAIRRGLILEKSVTGSDGK